MNRVEITLVALMNELGDQPQPNPEPDWTNAPEDATHWEPDHGIISASWMKQDEDDWYWWGSESRQWMKYGHGIRQDRIKAMIPRPQPQPNPQPNPEPDWDTAPKDATHWQPETKSWIAHWLNIDGSNWKCWAAGSWRRATPSTERQAELIPRPTSESQPNPEPDWDKAPEGATHWEPESSEVNPSWMKQDGDDWYFWHTTLEAWVIDRVGAWERLSGVREERIKFMVPRPQSQPTAEPETQPSDDWIKWEGGECPVPKGTLIDVRYRGGQEVRNLPALDHSVKHAYVAIDWSHEGFKGDIVAYRLARPQPETQPDWIEWHGGEMPVPEGTLIDVLYRDRHRERAIPAGKYTGEKQYVAVEWEHAEIHCDIVAYRLAEPEIQQWLDKLCEKMPSAFRTAKRANRTRKLVVELYDLINQQD
jgi:hypothetical protein